MKNNRRTFIKLAGMGVAGSGFLTGCSTVNKNVSAQSTPDRILQLAMKKHNQSFNMCGYGAPALQTVRAGFLGLGNRGVVHSTQLSRLEGVEIKALCDLRPERVEVANKKIGTGHSPAFYSGHEEEWKKVCDRSDI